MKTIEDILFDQYQLGRKHQELSYLCKQRDVGGEITEAKKAILKLKAEWQIEMLDWALNDYNMSDTDTKANLEEFISELKEGKL